MAALCATDVASGVGALSAGLADLNDGALGAGRVGAGRVDTILFVVSSARIFLFREYITNISYCNNFEYHDTLFWLLQIAFLV